MRRPGRRAGSRGCRVGPGAGQPARPFPACDQRRRRPACGVPSPVQVVLLPLVILAAGVITFFLVPLEPAMRAMVLVADVVAAAVVAWVLWRRSLS